MKSVLYIALAFTAVFVGMRIGGDVIRSMPTTN